MLYKKKPTIAIFCGSQKGNKTIYSSQSKKVARILMQKFISNNLWRRQDRFDGNNI